MFIGLIVLLHVWPLAIAQGSALNAGSLFSNSDSAASSAVAITPRVRAELVAHAPEGVGAGKPFQLGLLIDHKPNWHTYWRNPGDSGLPTELRWQLPPGLDAGPIDWAAPMKLRFGKLANYGYEGRVLLPVEVQVAPDWRAPPDADLRIVLEASWLVCHLECIPEQGRFELQLPQQLSSALHAEEFAQASRRQPKPLPAGQSSASADGDSLKLRVEGLPVSLQGQQLELFAESAQVLQHGAYAGQDWQQRWEGGVWLAQAPLSPDRQASAETLALVLTRLSQSEGGQWDPLAKTSLAAEQAQAWRIEVPVAEGWSGVARTAPSADLLLALEPGQAQAAPANSPSNGDWTASQWAWMLLFATVGGAALNLMPCVFPVLAIKALAIAGQGQQRRLQQQSALAYAAGVLLSFLLMGGLVLGLRAAGLQLGWGFQLQSPWFVALMALLFTVTGLALAGAVSFGQWLPAAWRSGNAKTQSPLAASFGTGVLAVLVASPCTGPFMGAALGAALLMPAALALAVFGALGIGMALPFLTLVWFPALLQRLPRPGAWMETFRTAMAFPMFASVAWLLWVLANQVGSHGAAAFLFVLWAVSFASWLWGHRPALQAGAQGLVFAFWIAAMALPLSVMWLGMQYFSSAVAQPPAREAGIQSQWTEWSVANQQQLLNDGRPLFVDFTASWCITCQYNKMTTLADAQVLAAFADANVQLMRADWSRQNPAITTELQTLGRSGVPTYALHLPAQAPLILSELLNKSDLLAALAALPRAEH